MEGVRACSCPITLQKFGTKNIGEEERKNTKEGIGVRQHLSESSQKCSINPRYMD